MTQPAKGNPASYFPSIEQKYGRPVQEWIDLINASAPAEELDQLVKDFIAPIIDKSPFAMRLTKMTIDRGLDADIQSLMVMEHLAVGNALQSEDAREGVNAFLEKREPKWVGR